MKRLRDDGFMNPQYKRPFGPSSCGELNGLPDPQVGIEVANVKTGGGSGSSIGATQKLTTSDALSYLKDVKDMFRDQREKYDCFLDVMKDFKAQRVDTAGVIGKVKELFKGHPKLILGFNTFLPKGCEISLNGEEETPKRTVEFEEAISFVNKIKKRFEDDEHVYKSFLDILNMYRKEHKGIKEVYQEVAALFEEHQDLLDDFTKFLPDTSGTAPAYRASFGRHSFHGYDERSSGLPTMRQPHMHKGSKRDVVGPLGQQDLSVDRSEMDDDKTVVKMHKVQGKQNDRENRDQKTHNQDDRDPGTETDVDTSIHQPFDKKRSARKLDVLGGNSTMKEYDDNDASKCINGHEFSFCEKVKERLQSPDDYQAFLKCLNIYNRDIITKKELQSLVNDLLGKYRDLMDPFNEFLERSDQIDGLLGGVMSKKTICNEESASELLRMEKKDEERKLELEEGKEKDRCNLKYWGKSIQELDLSKCQRCSPSYRLLPDDYPIPTASQRSELWNEVLNDHWVSVTSGSEDYSFKHMRRNQYEESLFRCEDDRFELDMLLESVSLTAKRVEELSNSFNNKSINSDGPIEDRFTALNLRCIERLYGDHGLDVMDILRKNPSLSLPVILTRLKQKQEEWTKCRSDFNKVWADIYSKNHYKSLDHRSFYFKQQDAKNLSTRSLVAEIKEIKDKKKKEDDIPLNIGAGSRHSISADLRFEYANTEIHEDVYKIIRYSCEEVCSTKEQVNKVLRLWKTFLEPLLGVHSQQQSFRTTDYDVSSKCQVAETMMSMMCSEESPSADVNTTSFKQPNSPCNDDSTLTGSKIADVGEEYILTSIERSYNTDMPFASGSDANRVGGSNEGKHVIEDIISSKETLKSSHLANGEFFEGSRVSGLDHGSVGPCKNEREEGELSPNGDFERNSGDNQEPSLQVFQERNFAAIGKQCGIWNHEAACGGDVFGENEADADDEDCENACEAGEGVSGSESAADEGSRDEHEEEERREHDHDRKPESECEAGNTSEAHDIGADGATPQSDSFLQNCKPLSMHVATSLLVDEKKAGLVFYGNDSFYVLFRLHQILYERILTAKLNSRSGEFRWISTGDSTSDGYTRFMNALFSLLDGSSDNAKFEDDCRSLIGNQSYVLFTLDKLIYRLVKQLQTILIDEVECKLLQLYEYESCKRPEKRVDSAYCDNAYVLLHDQNMYRLECQYTPARLLIQLMDGRNEKSEAGAVSIDPNFASYLKISYFTINEKDGSSTLMLKRNLRKYANLDESSAYMAMEKVIMMNGLECKMAANSLKICSGDRGLLYSVASETRKQTFRKVLVQRSVKGGTISPYLGSLFNLTVHFCDAVSMVCLFTVQ